MERLRDTRRLFQRLCCLIGWHQLVIRGEVPQRPLPDPVVLVCLRCHTVRDVQVWGDPLSREDADGEEKSTPKTECSLNIRNPNVSGKNGRAWPY
jgi:hypothetical protein